MPLYDFQCSTCQTTYEMLMPIKRFEEFEKAGVPCADDCGGTCYPVLGAPPFIERVNLRIADSRQRRQIK